MVAALVLQVAGLAGVAAAVAWLAGPAWGLLCASISVVVLGVLAELHHQRGAVDAG